MFWDLLTMFAQTCFKEYFYKLSYGFIKTCTTT